MKVKDYLKKELEKKYPDKDSLIDQIASNILLDIMVKEYESNKEKYNNLDNKDIYNELLKSAEAQTVKKEDDGETIYKAPPLPSYETAIDQFYTILTSKESNWAFTNRLTNKSKDLAMEGKGQNEITLTVSIEDVNGNTQDFTYFDWAVHDAIFTLKEIELNKANTPDQIYRKMYGITDKSKKPTKNVRNAIIKSADLINSRRMTIDCTEEARAYADKHGYSTDIDEYIIRDYMVSYSYHKMKMRGNETMGFQWHNTPMPLANAKNKKHYVNIEYKYVNIPGLTRSIEEKKLSDFLLRRIIMMIRQPTLSRTITLETIYGTVTDKITKDKKTQILNKVKLILDYWKEENFNLFDVYFIDYKVKRKRNKETKKLYNYAIEIKLENRKKKKVVKSSN